MNKQICLSLDELWIEKLEALAKIYGLTKQEMIKIRIGEFIGLLPKSRKEYCEKKTITEVKE